MGLKITLNWEKHHNGSQHAFIFNVGLLRIERHDKVFEYWKLTLDGLTIGINKNIRALKDEAQVFVERKMLQSHSQGPLTSP